jgi:ribosome biogenesis protein
VLIAVAFALGAEPPRPFDFIVDGELVRNSLEKLLLGHGISAETLLEVEYTTAVVPPAIRSQVAQDDW